MQTSTEVVELFAALAIAQGKYTDVVKDKKARIDSEKGSYGFPYADIASYIEAIRPALTEAKLAVIQAPAVDQGMATVTTRIVHASGQWVEAELSMPIGKPTPQAVGSAITYARRYSLVAMLCLAAEDDDGEQAERGSERRQADDKPAAQDAPRCPKCGGPMWDNREGKKNPKAPDYKCKNKACDGAIWQGAAPAVQPEPAISQTTFPEPEPLVGPMTPAQLRPWLLEAASRFANDAPLPEGWRKAIIGHLSRLTGGDAGRHTFLAWAFGVQSSNALTEGAWHALYSWLDIRKADDGKFYPSDLAIAEVKLAMAALAEAQKPLRGVDWNSVPEVISPSELAASFRDN